MIKRTIAFLSAVALSGLLWGCSELKEEQLPVVQNRVPNHPESFSVVGSPDFHGNAIRLADWSMSECQRCHGLKYDGGISKKSCRTCHSDPGGPENCATCHGSATSIAPPQDTYNNTERTAKGVGAHQDHLRGSTLVHPFSCNDCHSLPTGTYGPGHIDKVNRGDVIFTNSEFALVKTNKPGTVNYSASLPLFDPSVNVGYNYDNLTCANTYCHGNFKNGNTTNAPIWNDTTGVWSKCGTCHGDPNHADITRRALPKTAALGGTHPDNVNCSTCHGDVVNASRTIINQTKHINGKLNISGQEREF